MDNFKEIRIESQVSSYLAQAADILGEMPKSESAAVALLQQRAIDAGHDWISDIDDIEALVDATLMLEGKSIHNQDNPFKRIDKLHLVDQWSTLPDMIQCGKKCKKLGWILQERKMYYSLIRGGNVVMKIQGMRPTRCGKNSFRLMIPRMHTYIDLEAFLEQNDLIQFKNREWIVGSGLCEKDKEILGRYFFFEDLYIFLDKLTERIANDKKTEKLAGFQSNGIQGPIDKSTSDK